MRKFIVVFMLAAIAFVSCKKSSTKVAFTNSAMKSLFDSNCKSCHGSGASAKGQWLYDPTDYDGSIKTHISSIYNSTYTRKSMPQGTPLSQADLVAFKSWYDAGYPAN